jgi:hypothetical protein
MISSHGKDTIFFANCADKIMLFIDFVLAYSPIAALNPANLVLPSMKNSSANLTCSALGQPAPDIQWFNNGTKINGATQTTLQVQFISAEDVVSKYSCTRQDPNTRAVVCTRFYTCRTMYIYIVLSGTIDEATAKVTVNLSKKF